MPETTSPHTSERTAERPEGLLARVRGARAGLTALLAEADDARQAREEADARTADSAVCAWNHFENIPTFYNWNNRPR
ncbi:multiple cyclophane-containing RiPP AmcA [Spirilliplanes yamanashiensis]|uniref:Uncharacterized protein n=1 Tax=Spirilliplanes yamanashiensis TaxID=42233 RepID=A0A8J4DJ12_9ACTN|nr:multiple cyclophane-containing RiPP AmcA [Spirilliplanes yamanashiensis]MDP9815118.1 hypothetical protein [Spirilliplanes yamanashiensis]GIJ02773.1 hypothetical protein Sya03_21250 [Spirilliplanes yamanashiensis]